MLTHVGVCNVWPDVIQLPCVLMNAPFTRCFLSISTFSMFGLQAVWFGHLGTSTICLILLWKYGRLRQYNECVCPCCLTSGAFSYPGLNLNLSGGNLSNWAQTNNITFEPGLSPCLLHCKSAISTWSDCYGHWAPLTFVSTNRHLEPSDDKRSLGSRMMRRNPDQLEETRKEGEESSRFHLRNLFARSEVDNEKD